MPVADLHAFIVSLHYIIKARGCLQKLHLCPSPHRLHQAPHADLSQLSFWTSFLPRERWKLMRFTHLWDEIHFGKSTCNSSDREQLFLLPSPFSSALFPITQIHHFDWETVMNVPVYIVSKYTSLTPTSTPSVLYFPMIILLFLHIAYTVLLCSYAVFCYL